MKLNKQSISRNSNLISQINSLAHKHSLNKIYVDSSNDEYLDLLSLKTYTIDEQINNELDDAISLEKVDNRYIIWIHIADPASFIPKDSNIDLEARKRGLSIYFSDKSYLMLPREITDDLLSLKSTRVSPTLSAAIELDPDNPEHKSILDWLNG